MYRLFASLIIMFMVGTAYAGSPGEVRYMFSGGVGVGGSSSTVWSGADTGDLLLGDTTLFKDAEQELCASWNLGAGADYFITESVSLYAGFYYDSNLLRYVYERNTALNDLVFEVNADFMTIPLGIHFNTGQFFLGGGVYAGFLVNDDFEIMGGDVTIATGELGANNEFGIFLDAGIEIPMGERGDLLLFGRYQNGLSYFYNDEDIISDIRTRSLQFNVGYAFSM